MDYLSVILIGGAFVGLLLLWSMGIHNGLVRSRNHCDESWSGIDTELKRRHELIPNLVEVVRAYAAHERGTLEAVVAARARAVRDHTELADIANDESYLVSRLGNLLALVESYPRLKTDMQFLKLQGELANTENRIQTARRYHNANVRDLNNRIESFPSNVVARLCRFELWPFFEIDNLPEREVPRLSGDAVWKNHPVGQRHPR